MQFNSIDFMLFFPVVIAIYFVIPKKLRGYWLLVTSYFFYMSWNANYALLIGGSTVKMEEHTSELQSHQLSRMPSSA